MMNRHEMLAGRKLAPARLGRVVVLGLGVSGRSCAAYLLDRLGGRVSELVIYAGSPGEEARSWAQDAASRGARVVFDDEKVEGSFDLCIASPGISEFSDFYLSAARASLEVISEVEFAWRESRADSRWVAITGTNGKTTTTALCAHLLNKAGMNACAVGNIGDTCIDAVASDAADVFVAEVSSYQLASTRDFAPEVAVVLNITPDHLSWHRSHENYAAAKWKVLANLAKTPGSLAVLDACDEEVRAKVRELKMRSDEERGFSYLPLGCGRGLDGDMRTVCGSANAAFLAEGSMMRIAFGDEEIDLVRADELLIKGEHNVANALAASAAAVALGADVSAVKAGLRSFGALEHRIEPAGEIDGVACYNDSKATNVDAVLKALVAFRPVKPYILLGGRDKGTDLSPLVAACAEDARGVVCFGESRERFLEAFAPLAEQGVPVDEAVSLEQALDVALARAKRGDVVLLSPACASFDEFSCFEERGDAFKRYVSERAAAAAGR